MEGKGYGSSILFEIFVILPLERVGFSLRVRSDEIVRPNDMARTKFECRCLPIFLFYFELSHYVVLLEDLVVLVCESIFDPQLFVVEFFEPLHSFSDFRMTLEPPDKEW